MTSLPEPLQPFSAEIRRFQGLLASAKRVVVTTHQRPDGDAVGSCLATALALRAVGKSVIAHTPDPPPSFLSFLPGIDLLTHATPSLENADLVIALDHSELRRTGIAEEILSSHVPLVSIDHHLTSDRVGAIVVVLPDAAATAEILALLFPAIDLPIASDIATCLLTGIVTDTGSFQHSNTSPQVLRIAAELLRRGANLRAIVHATFHGRSLSALRITGRALERIETNPVTGAAVSIITQKDLVECGATVDDLAGVVNLLNSVPEAQFSMLLTEAEPQKLKGSLRSEPDTRVDVSKIAAKFGGGGHALASGFEIAGTLVKDDSGWRIA